MSISDLQKELLNKLDSTLQGLFYRRWLLEDIKLADSGFGSITGSPLLDARRENFLRAYFKKEIRMRGSSATIKQALSAILATPAEECGPSLLKALERVLDVAMNKASAKISEAVRGAIISE